MHLLLVAVVVGVLVGYARGGRLRQLALVPMWAPYLLGASLALQVLLYVLPESLFGFGIRGPAVALSYVLLAGWIAGMIVAVPRRLRIAALLLGAGFALNAAVIFANGAMPVSSQALNRVGIPLDRVAEGNFYKHQVEGPDTVLRPLGDVIPVSPIKGVISVGDIVLAVGVALFIAIAMACPRHIDRLPRDEGSLAAERR